MTVWDNPIRLMIVGAEKAGTTSLLRHLAQSPKFCTHQQQEMVFFTGGEYGQGEAYAIDKYFPKATGCMLLAKDVRLLADENALLRLKNASPDVKIVVMLREPASRAYSAYIHAKAKGRDVADSFEEAIGLAGVMSQRLPLETRQYIRGSAYAERVSYLLQMFGKDNVLIIFHSEYRANPMAGLLQIEQFMGEALFADVKLNLIEHNKAVKAKSKVLARIVRSVLRSNGLMKTAIRRILPHRFAVLLRDAIINMNKVEKEYAPLNEDTASAIREALHPDAIELVRLVGRCPWL